MAMKTRFRNLTVKLSRKLAKISYDFSMEHLKDEEIMEDVLNFTISAHLSSIFSTMLTLGRDDDDRVNIKRIIVSFEKALDCVVEKKTGSDVIN